MDYILMGMLLAVGWHLVQLIYTMLEELIFCRLHKAKWYNIAAGKQKRETSNQKSSTTMQIGFH